MTNVATIENAINNNATELILDINVGVYKHDRP